MKEISYVLPEWVIVPLFNSDLTGLTDQESIQLSEFSQMLNEQGYSAIPHESIELGLASTNDLDNLANNVHRVYFPALKINKETL